MVSAPHSNPPRAPSRLTLAWIGLALVVLSPAFWALSLGNNFLQRSALLMWLAIAAGVVCAALAAWRDRRKRTRIVAGIAGALGLLSLPSFFGLTRLPAAASVGNLDRVANLELTDHVGRKTTLNGLTAQGPALLVFYRGHW